MAPTDSPAGCLPDFLDGEKAQTGTGETLKTLCRALKGASLTPGGPGARAFWNIPSVDVPTAKLVIPGKCDLIFLCHSFPVFK